MTKTAIAHPDDEDKPCPNCGHCPTCGHTPQKVMPPRPLPWPRPIPQWPNTGPIWVVPQVNPYAPQITYWSGSSSSSSSTGTLMN